MASRAGEEFWRPVTLALSALAIIGWLLAAYLWTQATRTESEMADTLRGAEKAREALAADLQNLQKAAGTAADLKVQATEAEKALSEASAARASAQNELADLTKQINDAKLAISGAQEEASAKSRDLAIGRRPAEGGNRPARGAAQNQDQSLASEAARLQGQVDAARASLTDLQSQSASVQKQLETIQAQIQRCDRGAQRPSAAAPGRPKNRRSGAVSKSCGPRAGGRVDAFGLRCRAARACYKLPGEPSGDRMSVFCAHERGQMGDLSYTARRKAPATLERGYTAAELKASVLAKLTYSVGKVPEVASPRDWFLAVAFATRDLIVDRWLHSTAASLRGRAQTGLLLSLEFLIGRLLFDAMTNLGVAEPMAEALQDSASIWPSCDGSSRTRRSATAASAGSPPASWTAWRRSRSPRTATASATTTACSARSSAAAGSRRSRRTGCPSAIPGSSSARNTPTRSASAAGWRWCQGEDERTRHIWHPGRNGRGGRLTTRRSSAGAAGTSTRCACGRRARPTRSSSTPSTPATMSARLSDAVRAEAISKVLYPSDATPAGQELRLRQEYFFASASLLDLVRRHIEQHGDIRRSATTSRSSSTTPTPRSRSPN